MAKDKANLIAKVVGGLIILAGILAVIYLRKEPEGEEPDTLIRPLKVVRVGEITEALRGQYPGRVRAAQRVEMGFEVPGTLAEKLVKKGDRVTTGQELARLDARDFQNNLDAAVASLEKARANWERMQKAAAKNAVSKMELDNAEAAFEIAEAEMRIKQKALEDTVLRAMFDGIIADTYVDNFQNINAKQAILSLQDVSSLDIEVSVPEQRMAAASPDDQETHRYVAVFDYFPDRQFDVTLKEYSMEADPKTQTFSAVFALETEEGDPIFPGMTATVLEYRLPEAAKAGVIRVPIDLVPTSAGGGFFVWRVSGREDGTAVVERTGVEVGRIIGDSIEVLSGIEPGEAIAAAGVTLLRQGQIVRPMYQ